MNIIHRYNSAERQHYLFHHQYSFKLKPRLLYAGTLKKSPGWSEKPHEHDFCEILFIADGHGYITIENRPREVNRGDIIIYNSGILHAEANSETEPLEIMFMALDRLEITDLPKNHLLPPGYDIIYPTGKYSSLFLCEFERIIAEYESSDTFYVEIAESIARTLVMYIFRIINQQEQNSSIFRKNKNFDLALQYIMKNYRNDLSLEEIAENCFLNKYYLSHLFTQIEGTSIGKYVQNLRISEARKRLRETNDSVAIIANSVGFHDSGHFCRIFKKETGLTPLQYRKSVSDLKPGKDKFSAAVPKGMTE